MRRVMVVFWGSTASAVIFLGSAWAAAHDGGFRSVGNAAVLLVAVAGFLGTGFVSARVAIVAARTQRRIRGVRSASRGGR